MKVYSKNTSFPNSPLLAFGAVVGNPISSVYDENILKYTYDQIEFFRTLEADPELISQNILVPIENSGALFDAFKSTSFEAYKNTPLWTVFSQTGLNIEIATAKRRYKLQHPNASNLYMEVEIGIRGVTPTQNFYLTGQRPYIKINFSNEDSFGTLICSKDFSVKDMFDNSSTSSGSNGLSGQLRYIISNKSIAIYCHFLHISSNDYHTLGRTSSFTKPFGIPLGFIISVGDYFTPLSPSNKVVFVITSPSYENISTSGSAGWYGFSASAAKGSLIVHNQFFETRSVYSPQTSAGATTSSNPVRNLTAPFTHIFGNGTILSCPDLVVLSDPRRDTIDFVQNSLMYNGIPTNFAILPMMQSHLTVNTDWLAPVGTYVLGLKI